MGGRMFTLALAFRDAFVAEVVDAVTSHMARAAVDPKRIEPAAMRIAADTQARAALDVLVDACTILRARVNEIVRERDAPERGDDNPRPSRWTPSS